MNRKEAIMGIATIAAAAAVPSVASAQKPEAEAENPELEPIRALLKAYDTAFTNHDLDGVMATMSEKAAIMGTCPGEIWSGADEIKAAHKHLVEGFDAGKQRVQHWPSLIGHGLDADVRKRHRNEGRKRVHVPCQHIANRHETRREVAYRRHAFFDVDGRN